MSEILLPDRAWRAMPHQLLREVLDPLHQGVSVILDLSVKATRAAGELRGFGRPERDLRHHGPSNVQRASELGILQMFTLLFCFEAW